MGSVWQLTGDVYQGGSYTYIMMRDSGRVPLFVQLWYVRQRPNDPHDRQPMLRVTPRFERNVTAGFRSMKDVK